MYTIILDEEDSIERHKSMVGDFYYNYFHFTSSHINIITNSFYGTNATQSKEWMSSVT